MTAWVDCSSGAAYYGGWAADMGPYIGPWPLLPPGEMTGIDNEIDFIVGLPNPAHPGDALYGLDGTYDSPVWDAYRYVNSFGPPDTLFGYFGDNVGPSGWLPIPSTPPPGAHLYVVAYTSAEPVNPPEFYVPASYAAGGMAALETAAGQWTSTQPAYDTARTVNSTTGADFTVSREHAVNDADQVIPTEIDGMIADILASPAANDGPGDFNRIAGVKDPDGTPQSTTWVSAQVQMLHYDGTTALSLGPDDPTPPGARGIDWEYSPFIDADGNATPYFQFLGSPSWDWGLCNPVIVEGLASTSREDFRTLLDAPPNWTLPPDGDNTPLGLKERVKWESGDTTGSPTWTSSGTLIGDFDPVDESAIAFTPPNLVFDYSPITDLSFTLHLAPKFLYDGSVAGLTDFAMPSHGFISSFGDQMVFFPGRPQLMIHSGEWRYWAPGGIVPSGAPRGIWGVPA